jgi:hypothetical protein
LLGVNIPEGELVMNSSYSVLLKPSEDYEILRRLEANLPREIFPRANSDGVVDVDEVLRANLNCAWLDDVYRHGRTTSDNGEIKNKTPGRRSVSILVKDTREIDNPAIMSEVGRSVMRMYVYTCREMPAEKWQSRPATNEEYAAVAVIWREAWPYLTLESRRRLPTAWQYCVYQHVLEKQMGFHRDNFFRTDLKILSKKKTSRLNRPGRWCGVTNSQRRGTSVIVYSMGNCPMKMVFKKLSASDGAYQEKDTYEVCPSFTIECGIGYICVLDVIDDLLMMHGLTFEGLGLKGKGGERIRVAMVIRLLETEGDFFTDTSTYKLSGESLKFYGRAANWDESSVYRGVGS